MNLSMDELFRKAGELAKAGIEFKLELERVRQQSGMSDAEIFAGIGGGFAENERLGLSYALELQAMIRQQKPREDLPENKGEVVPAPSDTVKP